MPPTGSTFTDWQQVEKESRLLMDEDFSWSEPPQRSRRRRVADEPIRARRRTRSPESIRTPESSRSSESTVERGPSRERELARERGFAGERDRWDQPTETHSHFDEMMERWNAEYGSGTVGHHDVRGSEDGFDPDGFDDGDIASYAHAPVREQPSHSLAPEELGRSAVDPQGRRTVVITGRGDGRYMPAPRRARSSELRFHERAGFSPDRTGLWAVLLGVALLIGCVVH